MKTRFGLPAILRLVAVVAALGLFGSYVYFQHLRYGGEARPDPDPPIAAQAQGEISIMASSSKALVLINSGQPSTTEPDPAPVSIPSDSEVASDGAERVILRSNSPLIEPPAAADAGSVDADAALFDPSK